VLPVGGGPDGKSPLFVKNGTTVLLLFFCMHRHEDIYGPNSHEFDPDRWETIRPGWVSASYLPFFF
jgi:cytochrome P450